jgi:dolichol-phosphate mannosyltransferase
MTKASLVSIVIPCYNEEGNIQKIFETIQKEINEKLEIVFIDDGSSDATLKHIQLLAEKQKEVKYISFSRNFGHQYAIKAGIDKASGDCIIMLDADMQHPPSLIPEMIEKWREGYDIVNTIRKDTVKTGLFKRVSSRVFYRILNAFSEVKIEAGSADFRLIDKKVVNALKDLKEYHLFFRGLIPWIGFNQVNLDYVPNERFSGHTKYTFKRMVSFAASGITSFSTKPLKIAIYIGFLISFFAFLYALYALFIYFFSDKAISGWTSLIISILFIGGLQISLLGILGEYLGKLFMENKQRPHYIIKESNIN